MTDTTTTTALTDGTHTATDGTVTATDFDQHHVEFDTPDGTHYEGRVDGVVVNGAAVDIQHGELDLAGATVEITDAPMTTDLTITFE